MSAADFATWLEALVAGPAERRGAMAVPDITTDCHELVNGEIRPAFVVFFPAGAFVVTIAEVGPPKAPGAPVSKATP